MTSQTILAPLADAKPFRSRKSRAALPLSIHSQSGPPSQAVTLTARQSIHGHRSWATEVQAAGPLPHSALSQPVLCDHVEIAEPAVERG
jgi:hypothetical protein